MNPYLIDSHCHVHFRAYHDDYRDVVADALKNNVWMVTIGTQKDTSTHGIEVCEQFASGLWCSVGLHPNHLFPVFIDEQEHAFMTREEDFDYEYYKKLCESSKKVVAIGECGLDYYRMPEDRDVTMMKEKQMQVFRAHLDLAHEMNLPVVCHIRDAHDETIAVLREYIEAGKLNRKAVIHCFTSTSEHARQYVEMGLYVSFTGIITFPPKKSDPHSQDGLWDAVRVVPLSHLMIETDAPYLTPVPHRGERNTPKYVEYVAEKVAELHGLSVEEVARETTKNARGLFGI